MELFSISQILLFFLFSLFFILASLHHCTCNFERNVCYTPTIYPITMFSFFLSNHISLICVYRKRFAFALKDFSFCSSSLDGLVSLEPWFLWQIHISLKAPSLDFKIDVCKSGVLLSFSRNAVISLLRQWSSGGPFRQSIFGHRFAAGFRSWWLRGVRPGGNSMPFLLHLYCVSRRPPLILGLQNPVPNRRICGCCVSLLLWKLARMLNCCDRVLFRQGVLRDDACGVMASPGFAFSFCRLLDLSSPCLTLPYMLASLEIFSNRFCDLCFSFWTLISHGSLITKLQVCAWILLQILLVVAFFSPHVGLYCISSSFPGSLCIFSSDVQILILVLLMMDLSKFIFCIWVFQYRLKMLVGVMFDQFKRSCDFKLMNTNVFYTIIANRSLYIWCCLILKLLIYVFYEFWELPLLKDKSMFCFAMLIHQTIRIFLSSLVLPLRLHSDASS